MDRANPAAKVAVPPVQEALVNLVVKAVAPRARVTVDAMAVVRSGDDPMQDHREFLDVSAGMTISRPGVVPARRSRTGSRHPVFISRMT